MQFMWNKIFTLSSSSSSFFLIFFCFDENLVYSVQNLALALEITYFRSASFLLTLVKL